MIKINRHQDPDHNHEHLVLDGEAWVGLWWHNHILEGHHEADWVCLRGTERLKWHFERLVAQISLVEVAELRSADLRDLINERLDFFHRRLVGQVVDEDYEVCVLSSLDALVTGVFATFGIEEA